MVLAHPALEGALGSIDPSVWAVGGVVRDALLGTATGPDVDLVVEGDPAPVARAIAAATGGDLEVHDRFRTASVVRGPRLRIDLVGARSETYARPGALPDVRPGSLAEDLARRDFTANAVAMRLAGPDAGEIADLHGGRADLQSRILRLMRADGFEEDPSRLIRAARYAARLGLRPDPATREAAEAAGPALDPGSARVVDELMRLLEEDDPAAAAAVLAAWGVPWLRADAAQAAADVAAIDAARSTPGAPDVPRAPLRLAALVDPDRLGSLLLPGPVERVARDALAGTGLARRLAAAARPSDADALLRRAHPGTAVAALAAGAAVVARWWAEWEGLALQVDGADLEAAGVPRGPAVGAGLRAARAALLDEGLTDREAQLERALAAARAAR